MVSRRPSCWTVRARSTFVKGLLLLLEDEGNTDEDGEDADFQGASDPQDDGQAPALMKAASDSTPIDGEQAALAAENNPAHDGQDALLSADASSEHTEKGFDPYDAEHNLQKPQIDGRKEEQGSAPAKNGPIPSVTPGDPLHASDDEGACDALDDAADSGDGYGPADDRLGTDPVAADAKALDSTPEKAFESVCGAHAADDEIAEGLGLDSHDLSFDPAEGDLASRHAAPEFDADFDDDAAPEYDAKSADEFVDDDAEDAAEDEDDAAAASYVSLADAGPPTAHAGDPDPDGDVDSIAYAESATLDEDKDASADYISAEGTTAAADDEKDAHADAFAAADPAAPANEDADESAAKDHAVADADSDADEFDVHADDATDGGDHAEFVNDYFAPHDEASISAVHASVEFNANKDTFAAENEAVDGRDTDQINRDSVPAMDLDADAVAEGADSDSSCALDASSVDGSVDCAPNGDAHSDLLLILNLADKGVLQPKIDVHDHLQRPLDGDSFPFPHDSFLVAAMPATSRVNPRVKKKMAFFLYQSIKATIDPGIIIEIISDMGSCYDISYATLVIEARCMDLLPTLQDDNFEWFLHVSSLRGSSSPAAPVKELAIAAMLTSWMIYHFSHLRGRRWYNQDREMISYVDADYGADLQSKKIALFTIKAPFDLG